jgi:hypothetical protein
MKDNVLRSLKDKEFIGEQATLESKQLTLGLAASKRTSSGAWGRGGSGCDVIIY